MQDPFQFPYGPNRSIEDAILTLLHNTFLHTNNPKSYVRMLFADYSSAFNTIEPYHLIKKHISLSTSTQFVIWILNFFCYIKLFCSKEYYLENNPFLIIKLVILKCFFSREHIALSYKKWCEHKIRKTNRLKALCMIHNNI